ncbi:hypothetical protein F511_45345 [Dorcoceras hygrometricum]|uniref:Uncharacterized protein n=1 Tax=Dorcoceras hygrometricum TaxID=472368 RepID=A0A2Z6ZWF2_9LAMI|nr:hypothetical protein F511_45345 [Dorcoceras hygrometricum]
MLADRCCDIAGRSVREACRPMHVAGCAIGADARAGRALAVRLSHERRSCVASLLDARWAMAARDLCAALRRLGAASRTVAESFVVAAAPADRRSGEAPAMS